MSDVALIERSAARRQRQLRGRSAAVWTLTAVIALAALAVHVVVDRAPGPQSPALTGATGVVVLVALFAVAEALVIHLHVGRSAHTLSVAEAVVVVALLQATPAAATLAHVLGSGLTLFLFRRQQVRKAAFNLACFALETQLAAFVLFVIVGIPAVRGPLDWLVVYAAVGVYSVVGAALVFLVISIVERPPDIATTMATLRIGLGTTIVTVSMGIVSTVLLDRAPPVAALMLIPVIGAYISSQVSVRERRRRDELEFLHRSSEEIRQVDGAVRMIKVLADRAVRDLGLQHLEVEFLDGERIERVSAGAPGATTGRDLPSILDHVPSEALLVDQSHDASAVDRLLVAALAARDLRTAIVAPIRTTADIVGVLVVGDRLSAVATLGHDEVVLVEMLAAQLATLLERGRLERSVSDLRQMERRLVHELQHDGLTGLLNRAAFGRRLRHELASMKEGQHDGRLAVVLVDLDDFKLVNDAHGHSAGDEYLTTVADRIRGCLRIGDAAARIGGDEFAVLLERVDRVVAEQRADELVHVLGAPVLLAGHGLVGGGASLGIALDHDTDTVESILDRADLAMYQAKGRGKRTFHVVDPLTDTREHQLRELGQQLTKAFSSGEMEAAFQGVHDVASGDVVGIECLVRWRHASFGVLEPDVFLRLGLDGDVSRQMTVFTVASACDAIAASGALGVRYPVSVNLSGQEVSDAGLVATVRAALERSGADPGRLRCEVQLQTLTRSPDVVIDRLGELRRMGVGIVIDDVAVDVVSFALIARIAPAQVKLPRSSLLAMTEPSGRHAIRALGALGADLGFGLVAKGVEDRADVARLAELGVTMAQGHFYSRAVSLRAFMDATGMERRSSADRRSPIR